VGNLVLVMGSLAVAYLSTEGVLSLFVPAPIVWREPQEMYLSDPLLGHRLMPGQNAFTHSFPVSTNSYGFRDREFPLVPSPSTLRVLCLGDSLTFGDGVAVEDTYPKQLEKFLNGNKRDSYEVINTGVAGYDTWQEAAFLRMRGLQFRPSIVVLGFYSNDIVPKPSVVRTAISDGGSLKRVGLSSWFSDRMVHWLKRGRLLLLLKDRIGKLGNVVQPSPQFLHQQALLEGTKNDFVEQGWREVESSLAQIVELRNAHKFRFLLVIFPMAEQLMHEYPHAQYQERLRSIAEKLQIPYIDLQSRFEKEYMGFESLFIEWDGHPNPRAYRIAAEEISGVVTAIETSE
jgi:lysophospholipase L1-like esterase